MTVKVLCAGEFTEDEFAKMYEMMAPGRKAMADGFVNPAAKKLCILADCCIRQAVSEYSGVSPETIQFGRDSNGKPYVEGADFYINYSHSGRFAAAAVSEYPVGIDIEDLNRKKTNAAIKFATDAEKKYIGDSAEKYLTIWTLKEAHFKCTGEGIGDNLKDIEFTSDGENLITVRGGFRYANEITNNYVLSVCEKLY